MKSSNQARNVPIVVSPPCGSSLHTRPGPERFRRSAQNSWTEELTGPDRGSSLHMKSEGLPMTPSSSSPSGIQAVGDIAFGTHFCQFYRTQEDLADTLVPFFVAGLRNHELCMWVTSDPLGAEEARAAMREAM